MAREANSDYSEERSPVKGTAAAMKLFNDQDENNCCPSKAGGVSRTAALVEKRADGDGAHEQKLLFGFPVDEAIMKISTGLSMRGNKGYKGRLHRVGTSWLRAQKLPSVRIREAKKLEVTERYKVTQEDAYKEKEKKTQECKEKGEYTPLGATDPGDEKESKQDPSFLHAG